MSGIPPVPGNRSPASAGYGSENDPADDRDDQSGNEAEDRRVRDQEHAVAHERTGNGYPQPRHPPGSTAGRHRHTLAQPTLLSLGGRRSANPASPSRPVLSRPPGRRASALPATCSRCWLHRRSLGTSGRSPSGARSKRFSSPTCHPRRSGCGSSRQLTPLRPL